MIMLNSYPEWMKEQMKAEYEIISAGEKQGTDPQKWRPAEYSAKLPEKGVRLTGGRLKELFDGNVACVKYDFALPDYCEGKSPDFMKDDHHGWSSWLPGSNDGRMLGGAAGALRWAEDAELRTIVDDIIARIKRNMRADGYYNYYPEKDSYARVSLPQTLSGTAETSEDAIFNERKNYDRVFWTRGMIAAHRAGNPDALPLLRRMYDWFNAAGAYLPTMLLGGNSTNGMPGGPLMYHTALGRPEDILTSQRYFDQDYWMEAFIRRETSAFSDYPGERPHCYDLLVLETLAEEYRATGEKRYLDALLGAWEIYAGGYKHIGGATAICEAGGPYPYRSYYITTGHNGETCGSVFWIWVNSRLMQLFPEEEKYANEIEEALFNVLSACRTSQGYTRYHNRMHGQKERAMNENACCQVSSTILLSELPQYIYMSDERGIWLNLFAASEFTAAGLSVQLETEFPYGSSVRLRVTPEDAETARILHIRVSAWAKKSVEFRLNGEKLGCGLPGTYVSFDRVWHKGDLLEFDLPMAFTVREYEGADEAPHGKPRFALLYGPLLMALTGSFQPEEIPEICADPETFVPVEGKPLHFCIKGCEKFEYMPYAEVNDETFTCFPAAKE